MCCLFQQQRKIITKYKNKHQQLQTSKTHKTTIKNKQQQSNHTKT